MYHERHFFNTFMKRSLVVLETKNEQSFFASLRHENPVIHFTMIGVVTIIEHAYAKVQSDPPQRCPINRLGPRKFT